MAHRRTSSLVTQHQHQSKHHSPASSPVIEDEDQMPAHYSSAVGVGFHSFLSSSSAQSQTLPTIRDSLHVDVLLPEHTPQSPGTPSKLFPHPSPSTPSSSTLSPSSSSSSLTAYSPGSPRSRPLLRRLLNYISPSPSSSSASLLPLKSPLPSPTRTSHPYLLPSRKQRSPISSSHKFSPFSLTRLTSKSRLNSLSLPFPLPSRRRTTFIALLALLLISTWTILTTSLSSSSSSSSPVSALGPEGRGRTGSNKDKGWRALYLGVGVDVKTGGGGSTSGSSEDDKLLSFLGTSTSSPYNNANSNTRMKKPKHGGGAQRYRAGANGGGELGEEGVSPDGNEYLEGEDGNGGGMEEEVLREDEEYTLSPRAELAALTSFMASLPWNALPSYVDPSKPLSPDLVLDFDLRRGRSPSKGRNGNGNGNGSGKDGEREREEDEQLEELIRETWRDNPVVIFGKGRHARTRELRALIEKGLIVVVDDERSSPSLKGGKKNKNKKVKAVGVKGVTYFEMDARVDREVVEPVLHRLIYGSDSDSDAKGKKMLEYPLLLVGGKNVPIGFGEGEEYVQLLERESVRALVDVPALRVMKPGSGSGSGSGSDSGADAGAEGGVDKVDQERDVDKEDQEEEEREKEVDGESELVKKLRAAGARVEEIVKKKGKGRK
ncbi:hypothetical protein PNOK_0419100 [Pyrrhoderma noxium]|uniref:Uncharacterized protein n=1 Tax=Pyrrhoderma noxium TaxID=2282107 RepID=A0A286UI89_9AGAM|nr:hypothetical protein PNOK_0419100 [Pyrrhoderma noxium]